MVNTNTDTLVLTRGVDSSVTIAIAADGEAAPACNYDGGKLVFAHPMSLRTTDKHFDVCRISQHGYVLMLDKINAPPRCGLRVRGENYALELRTYGDDNDPAKAEAVSRAAAPAADFFLSPYSSGLTEGASKVAHENGKVMVAANSNRASVYEGRPHSFTVTMRAAMYLRNVLPMLSEVGAKTVQMLQEEGTQFCVDIPSLVPQYGMSLQREIYLGKSPTADDLHPIAVNMSSPEQDPDVVVACVYADTCQTWVAAMRRAGWSPRAQVLTVCVGSDAFASAIGTDARYMLGTTPWDRGLPARDGITDWSAGEFYDEFRNFAGETAAYQSAMAAGSVSVLTQAIERADSLEAANVSRALANGTFTTLYGDVSFDDIGINAEVHLLVQLDDDLRPQIVYPPQPEFDLVYPMPTWAQRDCDLLSPCAAANTSTGVLSAPYAGVCRSNGMCGCLEGQVSVGVGADAACHSVPEVNMNYIPSGLLAMGHVFFALCAVASVFFFCWTTRFRKNPVIEKSQPIFLHLVNAGCLIVALAIIPSGIQGGYDTILDPIFSTSTGVSVNVRELDAACMSTWWLFGIGFALAFSALFAKVRRIHLILKNAQRFNRVVVKPKNVMKVMVGVVGVEVLVLLLWQLLDPLKWTRTVTLQSDLGYAVESVGVCRSDNSAPYMATLGVFNLGLLLYAIWLCYITRSISSDFNESRWITASVISIFQILILATPVMVIVRDYPSANYCVTVCVLFLMSMSTMCLIFVPKFVQIHVTGGESTARESSLPIGNRSRKSEIGMMRERVARSSVLAAAPSSDVKRETRSSAAPSLDVERVASASQSSDV